jgi:hypothetical protein
LSFADLIATGVLAVVVVLVVALAVIFAARR